MNVKRVGIAILLWVSAALACIDSTAPGGQNSQDVTRTIIAFADDDGDGSRDPDEGGLPDVLVISDSNIHGAFTRLARLTDASGVAVISVTYTHFFDIKIVSPCGYTPTTSTAFGADARDEIEVGFRPDEPQPGHAILRFHVWDDDNQNGVQDAGEGPVGTLHLLLDIPVSDATSTTFGATPDSGEVNELAVEVVEGRGEISLGNSCGTLRVNLPYYSLWEPVFTTPAAIFEEFEGERTGVLRLEYGIGEMDIEIGVSVADG